MPKSRHSTPQCSTSRDEEDSFDESFLTSTPHNGARSKAMFSASTWPLADIHNLIDRIKSFCPQDDKLSFKTRLAKLDWSQIAFEHYTSEDCQAKWLEVAQNLRTVRTLSEICADASEFVRTGVSLKGKARKKKKPVDPDKPKKPLTPYLAFLMDYRASNPELCNSMTVSQLSKIVSEEFNNLSAKKKSKYEKKYREGLDVYRLALGEYRKNHPLPDIDTQRYGAVKPEPPRGPAHFFLKKLIKKGIIDERLPKSEQLEMAKNHYLALKDGKKIKFIRKSAADERRYFRELEEFRRDHPDIKIPESRGALTKNDRELKAVYDGKPVKPPHSGYHLFLQEQLEGTASGERVSKMGEISKAWKKMSKESQDVYNSRAADAIKEYKEAMAEYLSTLSEEERAFELASTNGKRKRQYVKLEGFLNAKHPRKSEPMSDDES